MENDLKNEEVLSAVNEERESLCKDMKTYEIASKLMVMGNILIDENKNEETFKGIMYVHALLSSELYIRLFAEEQVRLIEEKRDESINIPNEETGQAISEANNDIDMVKCQDANDMFDKLGINKSD